MPQKFHLDYEPYHHVDAGSLMAVDCNVTIGAKSARIPDLSGAPSITRLARAIVFLETGGTAAEINWSDTDGDQEMNWRLEPDAYWYRKGELDEALYCYRIIITSRHDEVLFNEICLKTNVMAEVIRVARDVYKLDGSLPSKELDIKTPFEVTVKDRQVLDELITLHAGEQQKEIGRLGSPPEEVLQKHQQSLRKDKENK